ncbi:4-(cytidine 5'-diphospho)-2-C-methyl-D-erythritol kinase [Ovoidimarina sediminis]|uniref:4-(cytidine 5'-diphospho)-2-C-methyl-D-erythritol kinase n=1 Tax=Ovoidimarina sediminis TaxID=3079856 RepID=UPI00290FCE8C|nr:4-(cytidine 5'-diphospho)-2-C-methyl-D-erythritol kinase [Rhodophyticola sp. MJ-SS7]MDU8943670.1 4-(cytidine 5'-diphospho)-2-C-methyl-D-erythritol kinase [Rhodophyticola sp. MJ-SS7]
MTRVDVLAPAKINLTLHITGQRDDGYHLLDSLVTFAPVGDRLSVTEANTLSLTVEGPEVAGVPADMENIALKAAHLMRGTRGAALTLVKFLPVASGIGGGSADAAAAVRACLMLQDEAEGTLMAFGPQILLDTRFRPLLGLGADIPMCLLPAPLRAQGIGDKITFTPLPGLPAVLVNPRVPVPTAKVFGALAAKNNPPMPDEIPAFPDAADLIAWLRTQRNDLEPPARVLAPVIGEVLDSLAATPGCGLARMSGSGATCFGLYDTVDAAQAALADLKDARPDWWIAAGVLGDMTDRAMPRTA